MLTIPKSKLHAASELLKENANPFNVDKNKIRNLAPATKAKLETFLVNFNTFVIYFDPTVDLSKFSTTLKGIRELDGTVAPFMRKGLTHYIIPNNALKSAKNSDKLNTAKKLGLVIWNISKLEKIIAICLELKNEPKPLKEILRDERLFGPSTSRDRGKRTGCKVPFKGNFLLIEEISGKFKPVAVKEFEKETWPTLQFNNTIGKCAFIKESKKNTANQENSDQVEKINAFEYYQKRITEMLNDKSVIIPEMQGDDRFLNLNSAPLNEMVEFEDYAKAKLDLYEKIKQNPTTVFQNSAASGLVSGSVAAQALKRDMAKDPRVAYLGTRVVSLVKDSKARNEVTERSVPGKSFYNRPGYCENCGVEYNRFYEHVRSRQHKHWAKQCANYKDLDILFAEMQREKMPIVSSECSSSLDNNVDIEALNADMYDSDEEYPFGRDIPPSIGTSKVGREESNNSETSDQILVYNGINYEISGKDILHNPFTSKQIEKSDDIIRTQAHQTEPIDAKFSQHTLHLDYQYGDTSGGGSQNHVIVNNVPPQGQKEGEDWIPFRMTRNRCKQEHLIMNPTEALAVETPVNSRKRSTNSKRGSSKRKRSTKQQKLPVREICYSLRDRRTKSKPRK